ncbi:MAG TPA: chromosome segregation protein SMC [Candidatus Limnocylindria bacterium]
MSRLRELRLHGFKTFADPTRFVFEPGVNAVIGPNGSGKSNMADAVRWVLGEQSNRSLRTRRADDVIFAGSQQRKPQGMAEAVLTLDNHDGWLPIDFEEVSIGRRAYRSGESEYLLNGARVRLRDVVELLGEGRLGANELVVVGQGTVDAALSLRPEERRQLFEEAAGVKNLQVRKNEALARLTKARDNLTRVTDLIGELKPQVRRLALQAQHAQEHDTLRLRAQALVLEDHRRRERAARDALGDARRRAAAAEAALEAQRAADEAGRQQVREAEEQYWRADAAAREAASSREAGREALIRLEGRAEELQRRLGEGERLLEQAQAELGELSAGPATAEADDGLAELVAAAVSAEAEWRAASAALAAADEELLAAEEALAEERRRSGAAIAEAARRGELVARRTARLQQLEAELRTTEELLAATDTELSPAREQAAIRDREAASARDAHEAALAAIVAAQPRADAARHKASELAERAGAARGERDALAERAEGGGFLGPMLAAAGWRAILDDLHAPEEAWPAIEAVVGGELEQALLWRDEDLRGRLPGARGSARLLTGKQTAGAHAPSEDSRTAAFTAVGAERTLSQWLGGNGAPALFAWTAVAPNLEALLSGWERLPHGWLAVTTDGDLADARGLLVIRGRAERGVSEAARRHARRRELSEMLEQLEAQQEAAAAEAGKAMADVSAAARELETARARREAAEEATRQAAERLSALELTRQRLAERQRQISAEQAQLAAEPGEPGADEAASDAGEALAKLEAAADQARQRRMETAAARDVARDRWQAAQAAASQAEERQLGAQRGQAVREARRIQLEVTVRDQHAVKERLAGELTAIRPELATARQADAEAARRRDAAETERAAAREALVQAERRSAAGGQLATLEREMQTAAVDVSRHEEALAALARERQLALESLPDGDSSESPEPGVATAPTEPTVNQTLDAEVAALSADELETELRRVRRTLSQIGSVNPFAVEEHRELATRLEELSSQDADLSQAINSTQELIATLDADIAVRFDTAFAAIAERFDDFCRLLFAGGSASLSMSDGSDGEAPGGIEIVVRPPGKRLQRLAMLSGGERALTGVALLFAMLSVNPVPFCILDEVDAALDEANIGRFADALRRLAQDIDFVVITHNRATIEVADTIYGVTMSDAAVSAIVSLRLADIPVEVALA